MHVSLIFELTFVVKFEKVTHFFFKLSVGRIRNVLIRIQIQIFILIQRIQQGSDTDSKTRLKYWIWILQNCKCSRTRQNERDPLIRQKIKRAHAGSEKMNRILGSGIIIWVLGFGSSILIATN